MTLEKLFSTLCERGWEPFGRFDKLMWYWQSDSRKVFQFWVLWEYEYYLRDMVSIESGLWQYVCNNKLQKTTDWEYERWLKKASDCWWDSDEYNTKNDGWYGYRVIESSLKDESELEEFLLDNIKIDKKYTEEEQELIDLDYWTWYTKKFVK